MAVQRTVSRMLTVGVDLAAEPARTALVAIAWDIGKAEVSDLILGADDDVIMATLADADKAESTARWAGQRLSLPFSPLIRPGMSPSRPG